MSKIYVLLLFLSATIKCGNEVPLDADGETTTADRVIIPTQERNFEQFNSDMPTLPNRTKNPFRTEETIEAENTSSEEVSTSTTTFATEEPEGGVTVASYTEPLHSSSVPVAEVTPPEPSW